MNEREVHSHFAVIYCVILIYFIIFAKVFNKEKRDQVELFKQTHLTSGSIKSAVKLQNHSTHEKCHQIELEQMGKKL